MLYFPHHPAGSLFPIKGLREQGKEAGEVAEGKHTLRAHFSSSARLLRVLLYLYPLRSFLGHLHPTAGTDDLSYTVKSLWDDG